MFGIPIIPFVGHDFDHADIWVVLAVFEPGLIQGLPKFFDTGPVPDDLRMTKKAEETGMTIDIEQQLHGIVLSDLHILFAVLWTKEPEIAGIIDQLYGHRPGHERRIAPDGSTEETGGIIANEFLDLIDRLGVFHVFDLAHIIGIYMFL